MRQRPPHDILITICLSPSPRSQEALGVGGEVGSRADLCCRGQGYCGTQVEVEGARLAEVPPWVPSLVPPGPGTAHRRAPSAAARQMSRSPVPRQKPFPVPTPQSPSVSLTLPRASSFARPPPLPRHRHTHRPTHRFPSQVPKLLGAGAARRPAGPGWPGAPSLTLSRQLTFSVGYTTFPQRAHWGFMIAIPGGGGGGCWLRGASVTSPGEPRTASGQAGGLRAAGAGWGVGAGPRVSARGGRRGLAPGAGRALGLAGAGARLRLGLRAAGSASLALQVRVTHTVTRARPSRSLAPPPSRRRAGQTHWRAWTEVAGNVHVGHPGREGAAGEGAGRDPESSADRRGCDFAAWGASLAPPPPQAGEPSQGHPHPRLTDIPGTQMSRGVRGQGAPSLLLQP
ncbi:uncharacterized protein LOC115900322 [Rhinopithecus roxellana]|uniref:uncharacterized protein LOC115900322 n=1 Tax=Rhinopithecus roxellana TaxID=61622 RepID=UPI0012373A6C|nr:uncharacterized protein LOC115900322 [Rhinopithecus roxellana]